MKKTVSLFWVVLLYLFTVFSAVAQDSNDIKEYKRQNAGKVMTMTSAGLALGGGVMILADFCDNQYSNGAQYISGALTAGVGMVMSLIGVPMWVVGNNKSDYIDCSSESQKGAGAIIGLELMNSFLLNVDLVGGYHLNRNLFIGGGTSAQKLLIDKGFCLPIYADARYTFSDAKYAPYINADLGYEPIRKGLYAEINLGTRIRVDNGTNSNSWWFGANVTYLGSDMLVASGLSLSYSF